MSALDPEEGLGCATCGLFGCDCDAPELISPYASQPEYKAVCGACHRAQCICKSALVRPNLRASQTGDPVLALTPEQKADQDMDRYWFERDPVGMRKRLVELHAAADRKVQA